MQRSSSSCLRTRPPSGGHMPLPGDLQEQVGPGWPLGKHWVTGRQGHTDTRGGDGGAVCGTQGEGSHGTFRRARGRAPVCPHLESSFRSATSSPKTGRTRKGPEKGSDMVKGTWGQARFSRLGAGGGRRGERERDRLRRTLSGASVKRELRKRGG